MPLAGIPPWRDQIIELFHGTTDISVADILQRVDEKIGGILKDLAGDSTRRHDSTRLAIGPA